MATLVVLLAAFLAWFSGNFLYDVFWAFIAQHGHPTAQASMTAYVLAHIVPFVGTVIIAVALFLLFQHEKGKGHLGVVLANTPPVAVALQRNPVPVLRPLRMEVGETGKLFCTSAASGLYNTQRTYNLKIENPNTHSKISGCKLQILKIEPQTEYQGPWLLKGGITLAAGDCDFIPLVTYIEARDPTKAGSSGNTFMIIRAPSPDLAPKPSASGEHIVTIKATALETPPSEFQCKVWVDVNSGRLRIEEFRDPVEEIPLMAAAKIAFQEIDGTLFAHEIEDIARSPEEILLLVMQQFLAHGLVSGVKWTSTERKMLTKSEGTKHNISGDGDSLTAQGSSTPIYHTLRTTQAGIDRLVEFARNVSSKL